MAGMHDSVLRLLDYAKKATASASVPVADFAGLARVLGVSSAVMTNWKARGVSVDGAMEAERKLGCYAAWVLDGVTPKNGEVIQLPPNVQELATFLAKLQDEEQAAAVATAWTAIDLWRDRTRRAHAPTKAQTRAR